MKKCVYYLFIFNLICITFSSCTHQYEEVIEKHLTNMERHVEVEDLSLRELTSCLVSNGREIEKAIKESNYRLSYTTISGYRKRYEDILKIYYGRVASEFQETIDYIQSAHIALANDLSYEDYLHYSSKYRVEVIGVGCYCGISPDDRPTYYRLGEELLDIYSLQITQNMYMYRRNNIREFFPSMDHINKYEKVIVARLNDDIYILNERYREYQGDYLKQTECADNIELLKDMIKKLQSTTYNSEDAAIACFF